MDPEQNTPNEEVIDLDALWNQHGAELPRVGDGEPTEDIGTRLPPPGRDVPETPTEPPAPDRAPPAQAQAQEPPEESKPAPAEGDTLEDRIRRLEAQNAKYENDLALAKKGQAAADRRANALAAAKAEAQQLEQNRRTGLHVEGLPLTDEEVLRGRVLQSDWVQRRENEFLEAEARAEQERQDREHADREADENAKQVFSRRAQPLSREMILLGLDPAEKSGTNPDDPDEPLYEGLLREALSDPECKEDIALTWAINDPEIQERLTNRVYTRAATIALTKLQAVADAKGKVESAKAARGQFDRESSPGPSRGGDDPYNNMHPDDMWQYIEWKS